MDLRTQSQIHREARARELSAAYAGGSAEAVIATAARFLFPGRIALVSSFGADAVVLLHMVSRIDRHMPVIFLETGKHFPETLAYRDMLAERLDLRDVRSVAATPQAVAADDPDGTLHQRAPDLCCHVRKSIPMTRALQGFDCWITGRKAHQTSQRAQLPLYEAQDRWLKLNPLHDWTAADVADWRRRHDLPAHPLVARGYPSIGCACCTARVADGADPRSGRWAGQEKTECGIHFEGGRVRRG
jgi:phosphoadenosine phosphosulfate reductase